MIKEFIKNIVKEVLKEEGIVAEKKPWMPFQEGIKATGPVTAEYIPPPPKPRGRIFYSTEEALELLGVNAEQLKEIVHTGKIREFRDGAKLMFKRDEVNAYIEGRK